MRDRRGVRHDRRGAHGAQRHRERPAAAGRTGPRAALSRRSALAAAAVRRHEAAGLDLGDPGAAARTRLAALHVDREEVADLRLERRRDPPAQHLDRVGHRGLAPRRRGRRSPRRPGSIACGTAAAERRGGSRRCRRCRSRPRRPGSAAGSSARPGGVGSAHATPRASAPGRRRQGRSRPRRGPGPPDPRRPAAGRPCPSASGRGSAPRDGRRRPAAMAASRVQAAGRNRPRAAIGPRRSTTAVLVGSFTPGAASWKRPVSIGFTTTRSPSRSIMRNLPRRRMAVMVCPTSASSSAGVPRTASGPGASADSIGRPRRAASKASATTVRSGSSGTAARL